MTITVSGAHNAALCFTGELDAVAAGQIKAVCDQEAFAGSKIRIMPDAHAGKGSTIGTTMTVINRIVPGMVGVDIGCGMETVRLAEISLDFNKLDALIRTQIPCGQNVRGDWHPFNEGVDLNELRCVKQVSISRARHSVGTLGGGNHFIEIDRGSDGALYLVVHSGSRHIGSEVAEYYQDEGFRSLCGNARYQLEDAIARLRAEGNYREIETTLREMKKRETPLMQIPRELAYVEGALFDDYIHDMKIIQHFAVLNRKAMVDVILAGMGLTPVDAFMTVHNYIDIDAMILRKGAVSAKSGEKLLIPMNMRDGSLICIGRGNEDWNCSAPHGSGRRMSRRTARASLSMEQYRAEMQGVYSTCVNDDTLDESPMAYKPMEDIVARIGPTAEIVDRIKPVYNFKASE